MAMNTATTPTFPTGPAIGEVFPDFTLPDQHGNPVHFSSARGGKRAMIVVHRSASW
ncbi:MAG: redoxin domain-containing protein [Chloroflexota bacterium]|nr:redoxin domain-containing protein [Chloroflexota bacterium]